MAKYLFRASLNPEGIAGVLSEGGTARRTVESSNHSVGGRSRFRPLRRRRHNHFLSLAKRRPPRSSRRDPRVGRSERVRWGSPEESHKRKRKGAGKNKA